MSDDKSRTRPLDFQRVYINEDHEMAYWTKRFACTRVQLETAVAKVGVRVEAVEQELGGENSSQ